MGTAAWGVDSYSRARRVRASAVALGIALVAATLQLAGSPVQAHAALAGTVEVNPDPSNSTGDPYTGGRVHHLSAPAGDNNTVFAATEQGGIFKSGDGGANWSHLNAHLPQYTWDVKVDPGNANHVVASSFYDGRVSTVAGIEVSNDGGATWSHPATATPASGCPAQFPADETSAFGIGFLGSNIFVGTTCGLAYSADSGATWTFRNKTFGRMIGILAQPGGTGGNGVVSVCGDGGFQQSSDQGSTWTTGNGFAAGICSLTSSPDESYVLFAAGGDNQAYESDDSGSKWNLLGTPEGRVGGRPPFAATNKRATNFDLWFGDVNVWRAGCTTPATPAPGGTLRCPAPAGWTNSITGAHSDSGDIAFTQGVASDACPRLFTSDGGVHRNTKTTHPDCETPNWQGSNGGLHALWGFGMSGARTSSGVLRIGLSVQDDGFHSAKNADGTPSYTNPDCCDVYAAAADPNRIVYTTCCNIDSLGVFHSFVRWQEYSDDSIHSPATAFPGNGPEQFSPMPTVARYADKQYAILGQDGNPYFTPDLTASPTAWNALGTGAPANGCGIQAAVSGGTPTFYLQTTPCMGINPVPGYGRNFSGASLWKLSGTGGAWAQIDNNAGQTGGVWMYGTDPTDPNRLYAANIAPAGVRMVSSTDAGAHWTPNPVLDRMMTGNGAFKYRTNAGPTDFFASFAGYVQPSLAAIDPNDANLVVAGGRDSGVFISADQGNSWGLMTDPFTPQTTGTAHLPFPRAAHFDHGSPAGSLSAVYIGSQGRGVWRLTGRPTTLTYNGDTSADFHDTANLSARLMDYLSGLPIVGAAVHFQLGTGSGADTCTGTTDATGEATCPVVVQQSPGATTVFATFDGDPTHLGSTTQKPFTVNKEETQLTYTGDTMQDYHDQTTLSATLTEDSGPPIANEPVLFTLGSQSCSGTTDIAGNASCQLVLQQMAGSYTVTASFAGDANHQPSTTSHDYTIKLEEDTLQYTGPTVIANGQPAHMRAAFKEDGTTGVAGRTIVFTLGSGATAQTCSAVTDATGTAQCDIVANQPLGPGTVTASFTSDGFYLSNSDTAATIVFAFLASGSFAIGDQNAASGTQVTYWGAQWAKLNQLSGGAAPRAFKGFAATTTEPPACGTSWTTGPGNSSDPPDSVPSYMGVIVSDSVSKSGNRVSGDTVEIVVVKTNPGYQPNPGHAGMGTVVAMYCHA